MNFKQIAHSAQQVSVLPHPVVMQLVSMIASSKPAIYDGRTYSGAEVSKMLKDIQQGIKPVKVPIYAGDFCMTQGVIIRPEVVEDSGEITYPVQSLDNGIELPIEELPVNNGVVNLQDLTVGNRKYYIGSNLKEDIKVFASMFKYVSDTQLKTKVWQSVQSSSSVWVTKGYITKPVPYRVLEHIVPPTTMHGQALIEYLYTTKSTWNLVRTAVAVMLQEITAPILDEHDQFIYDDDGSQLHSPVNSVYDIIEGEDTYEGIIREVRPPNITFKCSADPYIAKMQLDKLRIDTGLDTILDTHNDYYDGIDYSANLASIKAKIIIMHALDLKHLPNKIGVVTNQTEEFLVVERYFNKQYPEKALTRFTEKSAHNFKGFKIFMSPISTMATLPIYDKTVVSRAMIQDSGICESIVEGEYPEGFGFMTNLLVNHHCPENYAREKKAPGEVTQAISLSEDKWFKQLHSEMPLYYYPYIYSNKADVDSMESRDVFGSPLANLNKHVWALLNYPVTKYPLAVNEQYFPYIRWTPGKTATDVMFELDQGINPYQRRLEGARIKVIKSTILAPVIKTEPKSIIPVAKADAEKEKNDFVPEHVSKQSVPEEKSSLKPPPVKKAYVPKTKPVVRNNVKPPPEELDFDSEQEDD